MFPTSNMNAWIRPKYLLYEYFIDKLDIIVEKDERAGDQYKLKIKIV